MGRNVTILTLSVLGLLLSPALAQAPPPPMPALEDQLYMIGRAQEEEIKQLRKQIEELTKQIEELKKKAEGK